MPECNETVPARVAGGPTLKYALIEREHRFLLAEVPPAWRELPPRTIHDRYVAGTRLRVRTVETPGRPPAWKLGQKIRVDPHSPVEVAHTTIYLDEAEASTLARLPAAEVVKLRRVRIVDSFAWAVDEFMDRLAGLILAEVDLGPDGSLPAELPFDVVADVSEDERFTGGALCRLTAAHLSALLASFRP